MMQLIGLIILLIVQYILLSFFKKDNLLEDIFGKRIKRQYIPFWFWIELVIVNLVESYKEIGRLFNGK